MKSIAFIMAFIQLALINPLGATIIFNEDDAAPEFPHGSLAIFYTYEKVIGSVVNDQIVKYEPNYHHINHGFTGEWVQGLGNGFFGRIDIPVQMEFNETNGQSAQTSSWGDPTISSKWVYVNSEDGPRAALWTGVSIPANGPDSLGVLSPAAKLVGGLTAGPGRLVGNLGYAFIPIHKLLDRGDIFSYAVSYEVLMLPNLTFPLEFFGNNVAKDKYHGAVVNDSGSRYVFASGCFAYTFFGEGMFTLCGGVLVPVLKKGFGDDFSYLPHITLFYNL